MTFTSLILIAFVLGVDSFSLCLTFGLYKLSHLRTIYIAILFGLFHTVFPLLGMVLGRYILYIIEAASFLSGVILLLLGLIMIYTAYFVEAAIIKYPSGIYLILMGMIASLDSLSIGLSLGMSKELILWIVVLFGLVTIVMSFVGIMLGNYLQRFLGKYSEIFGGLVLIYIGIKVVITEIF